MRIAHLSLFTLVAVSTLLVGCQQKFTRDRFEMIKADVDQKYDVEQILGEPEFRVPGEWYYENQEDHYAARIFFEGDTVVGKEWMDARSGEWDGSHPQMQGEPAGESRMDRTRTRQINQ